MTLGFKLLAAGAVAVVGMLLFFLQRHRDATIGFVARNGVPMMMTIAYIVLALTSGTDATGVAWLSIGLAFVMVVWWILRYLMTRAALSRALAVGEVDRVLELAGKQIRQRRGPARLPYQIARVRAFDIRGDWASVLASLDEVAADDLAIYQRWECAALRARALVELDRSDEAETALGPLPAVMAPAAMDAARAWIDWHLARARVWLARGDTGAATKGFRAVVDNIRTTAYQRAIGHLYLVALEPATATKHAAAVTRFAPAESWIVHASRQ